MVRYKVVDRSPRFLPIVLEVQLTAGSFEYALDYLMDPEIDLSGVGKRYTIDSDRGRKLYGRRIAIVEPVFANLWHNKRLDRFTLRTQPKVNTQWNLYCLVHNLEKLAHPGYGTWHKGQALHREG